MSHAIGSGMKAEPNLTPLLDMVLQLVMFFMLVANFTMQEANEDIKLPLASQTGSAGNHGHDVLYLNIDRTGRLSTLDGEYANQAEIHTYLDREYRRRAEQVKSRNNAEPDTVVIIRADRESGFAAVFTVLREAKQAGFKHWTLRAQIVPQG
jgi:biopolymer transport protein ExbD